jgi:outer membrane protein
LGYGQRSNPITDGDDIPVVILPKISYYGERFFLENLSAGWTLVENERHQLNLLSTLSFDQMYFRKWSVGNISIDGGSAGTANAITASEAPSDNRNFADDIGDSLAPEESFDEVNSPSVAQPLDEKVMLNNLDHRETALFAGLEHNVYLGQINLSSALLKDVSGTHEGYEMRFAASIAARAGNNNILLSAGLNWQSAEIVNYYYGVGEGEINNPELYYVAGAGTSSFVRVDWERQLSKRWSLQASALVKALSSNIQDSPIVGENTVSTVFVGGVYHF